MPWGFDLIILAGAVGVGGSYITVKSNLEPVTPQLAGTYFGANPYQLRNMISMRTEAIAGTIWLGFSLVFVCAGTILSSVEPTHLSIEDSLIHAFVVMGLTCLLLGPHFASPL